MPKGNMTVIVFVGSWHIVATLLQMRQLQMQQHGGGDSPNLASSWDKGKFDED
jgi:hypothetical protein